MSIFSQTNEQALEASIEKALTGYTTEELKQSESMLGEPSTPYGKHQGYVIGDPHSYDKKHAIDTLCFWGFLEDTQVEELEKVKRQSDWKNIILTRFDRLTKRHGILHLLKNGLKVNDAHFTLFFQPPLASSSQRVKDNFDKNIFSITRQVNYSEARPLQEIDIVLFINGIAISTMELKNPWTGQSAAIHGINQYKTDRDTSQPLLNFGRCIVHFAVDTDEVFMTTKLAGKATYFLPFNIGYNSGKGNPMNSKGHKTSYLWEEILSKESLANIIQHFVRFDGGRTTPLEKQTLYFPRYHQLNVVRKIIADVEEYGSGKSYLIQHSAGSGKSNSITWAAYQLIDAYPLTQKVANGRRMDLPLFDSVIVVTDRRLLDKQLRENIASFSEVQDIVAPAFHSNDLRKSLEQSKRIIITTIQKFPFIVDEINDMSDKRFAVLIDEAHSSQSGSAADALNRAIGESSKEEESDDIQDKLVKVMQSRKMRGNASYFAFTATPKNSTLERFGIKHSDGSFKPFHLYSMKQAIEEGFILDVVANYSTYRSYYELQKSIEDNPLFDTKEAQMKLKTYVESYQQTIDLKAEIIYNHFFQYILRPKRLKGQAKAMVITQSIEAAIRYYHALRKQLDRNANPFKIVIAFSGTKIVDGIDYTEAGINGFPEKDTRDKFDDSDYRILVVANKYLTGFDQPKLTAMYVDKRLQDVLAVQALSRLNRSANSLGKRKEDLFVLDFFNTTGDIKSAFDTFYTSTSLERETDVNVLNDLLDSLELAGVYTQEELNQFILKYFNKAEALELSPIIDSAANRFNHELEWEEKEKADYKIKANQFVKIYGQVAALLPFEVVEWEKLFWFMKFLIPKLKVKDHSLDGLDELLNAVDLSSYGIERVKLSTQINLIEQESVMQPQNPNPRGAHDREEEVNPLTEILESFNQKWFSGWSDVPESERVNLVSFTTKVMEHPDFSYQFLGNDDIEKKDIAFEKIFEDAFLEMRKLHLDWYKKIFQNPELKDALLHTSRVIVDKKLLQP